MSVPRRIGAASCLLSPFAVSQASASDAGGYMAPPRLGLGVLESIPSLYAVAGPDVASCSGSQEEAASCGNLPSCQLVVHCKWSEWEDWYYAGGCTGLCYRHRDVKEFSSDLGKACSGSKVATKPCLEDRWYKKECSFPTDHAAARLRLSGRPEKRDCEWADWSSWSACSRQCGGGEASRDRHIKVVPQNGGTSCEAQDMEVVKICNAQPCQAACTDGRWGPWEAWEPCSVSCGGGLQRRTRRLAVEADTCGRPAVGRAYDLRPCGALASDALSGKATLPDCAVTSTPKVCSLGEWREWGTCTASCGFGERSRARPLVLVDLGTALKSEVARLRDSDKVLRDELRLLRAANETMQAMNKALLANSSHQLAEAEDRAVAVEVRNSVLRSHESNLLAGNKFLQEEISTAVDRLEEVSRNLTTLRRSHQEDVASLQAAKANSESITSKYMALHSKEEQFRQQIGALQKEKAKLSKDNEALRLQNGKLFRVEKQAFVSVPVACGLACFLLMMGALCFYVYWKRREQIMSRQARISRTGSEAPTNADKARDIVPLLSPSRDGSPPASPKASPSPIRAKGTLLDSPAALSMPKPTIEGPIE